MPGNNHLFNGARADDVGMHGRVLGETIVVPWSDIRRVAIRTTDGGPFLEDVFVVFTSVAGHTYAIPHSEADGAVLARLQELDGFDNEAVIRAMTSTSNAEFVCWEATEPTP